MGVIYEWWWAAVVGWYGRFGKLKIWTTTTPPASYPRACPRLYPRRPLQPYAWCQARPQTRFEKLTSCWKCATFWHKMNLQKKEKAYDTLLKKHYFSKLWFFEKQFIIIFENCDLLKSYFLIIFYKGLCFFCFKQQS